MRPLKKGAARTALAESLDDLVAPSIAFVENKHNDIGTVLTMTQIAAIVGGAIDGTLDEMNTAPEIKAMFWRLFNHNLWNLIRSLRASNQLGKV